MKQFMTFAIALLMQFSSVASDTSIVFRQVKYSQVFEFAKKENKAVMLYFHFPGCKACIEMEKTVFNDKKVVAFYNTNFICFDINTMEGEGIETNKIYNIHIAPTFLFIDKEGVVLTKLVSFTNPDNFLKKAKDAIDLKSITNTQLNQQYSEGNRDPDFLFNYCYRLSDSKELDPIVINEYLDTQTVIDLKSEKNIRFIYDFVVYVGKNTIPVNSMVFDFILNNRDRFYQYFDKNQVDARMAWILNDAVYSAIEGQDEKLFTKYIELLKEYDSGEYQYLKNNNGKISDVLPGKALVLKAKVAYYDKSGDIDKYNDNLNQYLEKIWNDFMELNEFAWNSYIQYDDKEKLEKAVECIKRSTELNSDFPNTDTYARLLYKLGDYDHALIQAEKAIDIAKENDFYNESEPYKETIAFVERIKAEQKKGM